VKQKQSMASTLRKFSHPYRVTNIPKVIVESNEVRLREKEFGCRPKVLYSLSSSSLETISSC
jgi:hypothetical protein